MASLLKSRRTLVILTCFAFLPLWYWIAYPRGVSMAYIDHLCGHYQIRTNTDLRPDRWEEYERELSKKYGVKVGEIGDWRGVFLGEEFIAGYNSTSERLLIAKYRKNIFEECAELTKHRPGGADW